jgi:hypothetical protein
MNQKIENVLRELADFKPSGRAAYDRFMRYRAELAKSGDLIFDQRHRLMCRTEKQQQRLDDLWHRSVLQSLSFT